MNSQRATITSRLTRHHLFSHVRLRLVRRRCLEYRRHFPIARVRFYSAASNSHEEEIASKEMLVVSDVLLDRIRRGQLLPDHAQERAARRLTKLQEALVGYSNETLLVVPESQDNEDADDDDGCTTENVNRERDQNETKDDKKDASEKTDVMKVPRGLFVHGEVGTGKSMLMDTFFSEAPVERKRRVHFHSFMQDVHGRIHELKQLELKQNGRSFHVDTSKERNPIYKVAKQLASEMTLLCFDEFQVTDVADALILSQLFSVLFQHGTVVVATSNRPPSDLYEGGINRSYFLPFIDLIHRHCIVHQVQSTTDYRLLLSEGMDKFFLVDSGDFAVSKEACGDTFLRLLNGRTATSVDLDVSFNRTLTVKQADPSGVVGRFEFDELCNKDLGSSDYRSIAENFSVVILERVPLLTLKDHNQARRFITLVDELYEGNCALLCSAVADPERLFVDSNKEGSAGGEVGAESIETKVGESFGIDVAQSNGKTAGELASVRELSFAFRRAASRLTEMCSRQWWEKMLVE